jgi:dTDP-4-dehydrorhamnose 3,5-epimerase-like enzyme
VKAIRTPIPDILICEPEAFCEERGLHYQTKQSQDKLVCVASRRVFDVAVHLRNSSAAFGRWVGTELGDDNYRQLWIPSGFAHGFLVLSESADVLYKSTNYYAPAPSTTSAKTPTPDAPISNVRHLIIRAWGEMDFFGLGTSRLSGEIDLTK